MDNSLPFGSVNQQTPCHSAPIAVSRLFWRRRLLTRDDDSSGNQLMVVNNFSHRPVTTVPQQRAQESTSTEVEHARRSQRPIVCHEAHMS
jgi:hypothetical protein